MASHAPQRSQSHGPRGSFRNQRRYVPKNPSAGAGAGGGAPSSSSAAAAGPSSRDPPPSTAINPPPPLTASLRAAVPAATRSEAKGKHAAVHNFVNYLPQDEAVASGLAADAGALEVEESQAVVDLLNDQLSRILKLRPRDFWKEVASNDSLRGFLDSYLQFRSRWYDFQHRESRGAVAGVIVGEVELSRRVFMVLYRISSNKDPGAPASQSLSVRDHAALLQERALLDLPRLLDICAIYGHENGELTRSLVSNAIKVQPRLSENISGVVSHFLSIVHTVDQRCSSSLEAVISVGGQEENMQSHLYEDFLEVLDFINDAIVTLDAFADAYEPAAFYLSLSFEMSHGNEEILNTLARLHDALLPSLKQGLALVSNARVDVTNVLVSLKMLTMRIVKFGWKLLDCCYLSDEAIEDNLLQASAKMFPAKVEDPSIRGDILVQTLKEISGETFYHLQGNHNNETFIRNIEKNYKLLGRINSLRSKGWIFMDEDQFQYLSQIATPLHSKAWENDSMVPSSSPNVTAVKDEDDVIMESKISQIKDLFPDYGKGFLSACLEAYNHNPEEVIQRILDGTLHEDLRALDTSLEHIPPSKKTSHNRNDKGKGVLVESDAHNSALLPTKVDYRIGNRAGDGSSYSSSTLGRYTRKSNDESPASEVLDSRTAKDDVRAAVLAAEYEYEDEYDDSFDDLGLSIADSGYEEAENLSDKFSSLPGKSNSENSNSSQSFSSRGSLQKKTQFYVKDGKNYSYKVAGSVAVSNAQEAAIVNEAQKEVILGLGRGGNIPLGASRQLMNAEEKDNTIPDVGNSGRGSHASRGRGGRRGGGANHYRKDRAMKKHFAGLGGS